MREISIKIPQIVPNKKPVIFKKKQVEKKKIDKEIEKKANKKFEKKIINTNFILPQKKPETYRKTKTVKKSNYLSQKDFDSAKIVFEHVKNKKWITAYKSSMRIKDKDFKILYNGSICLKQVTMQVLMII